MSIKQITTAVRFQSSLALGRAWSEVGIHGHAAYPHVSSSSRDGRATVDQFNARQLPNVQRGTGIVRLCLPKAPTSGLDTARKFLGSVGRGDAHPGEEGRQLVCVVRSIRRGEHGNGLRGGAARRWQSYRGCYEDEGGGSHNRVMIV